MSSVVTTLVAPGSRSDLEGGEEVTKVRVKERKRTRRRVCLNGGRRFSGGYESVGSGAVCV